MTIRKTARRQPGRPPMTPDREAELNAVFEDESTEYGAPLPRDQWPAQVGRGRPSLSGKAAHSPQIVVRLDPATLAEVQALAAREGKSVSAVAREALERYLHAS